MTASKGGTSSSQSSPECCMCGDFGLPHELFQCKVCQFRSQHRYCSNLYPKAESYQVCNWCLSHETKEKSQNSSNSSSSNKNNSEDDSRNNKKKKGDNQAGPSKNHRGTLRLQINSPIKKQRSPERSPSTRRRLITNGKLEEKLRRTRSEEISNNGFTKQVFRNKVRSIEIVMIFVFLWESCSQKEQFIDVNTGDKFNVWNIGTQKRL
ncbi:hypothetical protein NC651_013668 [Populus alba x Populus x berolinensis]|nr:hypothetical protein NC651_013668 [Populus alba x Populus x berolinensis]